MSHQTQMVCMFTVVNKLFSLADTVALPYLNKSLTQTTQF